MANNGPANVDDGAMKDHRAAVAEACVALAYCGLGDMVWGHVSLRDAGGRGTWIKGRGSGLEEATSDDSVLIDREGRLLDGERSVPLEYAIHTELLAARPDVNCVVHAHASAGIAFAATGVPLRPISHDGTLFVPPDIVRFTDTGDLIRTNELGVLLAQRVGNRNAALMVSHGIVTVGVDVATAVMSAVLLERACRQQLTAMAAAPLKLWSSDEEALTKRESCWAPAQLDSGYDYLVRRSTAACRAPG